MTKRALLIGSQTGGLDSVDTDVAYMADLLGALSFETDVCTGRDATRVGIISRYRQLSQDTIAGDAAVIYYSGCGGLAANPKYRPMTESTAIVPHYYQFIVPVDMDESSDNDFRGIMSCELSALLEELTTQTKNVTVILDCCYTGRMSRNLDLIPKALPRPWYVGIASHLKHLKAQGRFLNSRHVEGNPNVVRLVAAGLNQSAYEYTNANNKRLSIFTESFAIALREVKGLPITWDTIGKRVRERVFALIPSQRPEIEGPVDRLLFELEEPDRIAVLKAAYQSLKAKNTELQIATEAAEALTQELLRKNSAITLANQKLQQEIARREQAEDALKTADEQLSFLSEQEAKHWGIEAFIGKSKIIGKILEDIRRLHNTSTTNVLIIGESGTGKELIARAIHFGGPRAKGRFIAVNCSAIPSDLAESMFFGHLKGAFTGANTNRKGYFEVADGGTLFLDEIGNMPVEMQAKLLRVLEDGCFIPVGGTHEKRVDVRILAATNADLQMKVTEGSFRRDLYHRLAVFPVVVPPLRNRAEDIPLLTEHFLKMFAEEMGIEKHVLCSEAQRALESYHFPGNVRELKNIIERALIESGGTTIQPEHLHFVQTITVSPVTSDLMAEAHINENRDLDVEELYQRLADGESFWDVIRSPFMARELNRFQVKAILKRGLEEVWGSYKALLPNLGLPEGDYQKFMDFLRHHKLKPKLS